MWVSERSFARRTAVHSQQRTRCARSKKSPFARPTIDLSQTLFETDLLGDLACFKRSGAHGSRKEGTKKHACQKREEVCEIPGGGFFQLKKLCLGTHDSGPVSINKSGFFRAESSGIVEIWPPFRLCSSFSDLISCFAGSWHFYREQTLFPDALAMISGLHKHMLLPSGSASWFFSLGETEKETETLQKTYEIARYSRVLLWQILYRLLRIKSDGLFRVIHQKTTNIPASPSHRTLPWGRKCWQCFLSQIFV